MLHFNDDNFCWLQFYVVHFLELDCIIFIAKGEKDKIVPRLPALTENLWLYFYKDKDELLRLSKDAIDRYTKKVMDELSP